LWVELGLPEDKLIRRASHRARQGMILAYGGTVVDKWWANQQKVAKELDNLTVVAIKTEESQALTKLCQRTMQLQCTIQEGQLWFADNEQSVVINPILLKVATNPLFTLE
jgi:uncharacterized protein YaeQ